MKRIANHVAVETLLYTMPANKVVKIMDMDHHLLPWSDPIDSSDTDSSLGLTYTVDEILNKIDNVRIARAKIRRTAVNEGLLLLVIDTKNEEY